MVIAKAAIDRLLSNRLEDKELIAFQNDLEAFSWMVIPASQNPCAPGQGALALEVKTGNREIIELLNKINDLQVFNNVQQEREKLKKYGGGCHQKIGVSIEDHPLGKVITEKGLTPDSEEIDERTFVPFKEELSKLERRVENFFRNQKKTLICFHD